MIFNKEALGYVYGQRVFCEGLKAGKKMGYSALMLKGKERLVSVVCFA